MKKSKQPGGVLGRNQKHYSKIKNIGMVAIFMLAMLLVGSMYNDAVAGIVAGVASVGGLKALAVLPFVPFTLKAGETEEQLAERNLVGKILHEAKAEMASTLELTNGQITKLQADLAAAIANKGASEDQVKELIRLAGEVKALKEVPNTKAENAKSFKTALADAFALKSDEIKEIVANGGKQSHSLNIEVKAAVDMTTETTIGAGTTQYTMTDNTGIISVIRQRSEKYLAAVSVGSTSGNRALWVEETNEQGTPIFIGEGDTKTRLSVLYVEKTANVKKIAVYGKVTTEMLADLPQLISYIQNNLMKRLDIVVENQLLTGDNIGDNLNGLDTVATAFSAGAMANLIQDANEFDVINAIATQVELANGIPNAIFIHPSTMQALKAVKTSYGEPLWKTYTDMLGEMTIAGMKVISTPAITAGKFIGGDLKAANVLFREQMNIQIGLDGNDFINNKKTILVEKRLVQFVSANDVPVIINGDFATAKAALLKP